MIIYYAEIKIKASSFQTINTRILEVSDRAVAFHITKVDWAILRKEIEPEDSLIVEEPQTPQRYKGIYENVLNDSQFRWNHVIERYLIQTDIEQERKAFIKCKT